MNMRLKKKITILHQPIRNKAVLKWEDKLLLDYPLVIIYCPTRNIKTTTATNKQDEPEQLDSAKVNFLLALFHMADTRTAL